MVGANTVLMDAIWPVSKGSTGGANALFRNIILAVLGSALLAITAKIQVPMYPVPMTMQTFAVLLIGLAFGWRLGAATVALYLLEGTAGLPVFSKGGGLAYFAGPTGGYLIGFFFAAAFAGWLAERGWSRPVLQTFLAMVAGTAIIYGFGVGYLSTLIGLEKAFFAGMVPFLIGDLVKAALAAAALPLAWKLLGGGKGA